MTEVSEVAEGKLIEWIKRHGIVHKQINVRPWGSYDLILESAVYNGTMSTGQTFGWGFTTERAAAIAIYRLFHHITGKANLTQWLGVVVFTDLSSLMEVIDRVAELKAEIQAELPPTGSLDVSEHIHNE